MHWIDWVLLFGLVVFITVVAIKTKKYTQSVADFLSANRCLGKYLIGVGDGMAGLGAITIIAVFEMCYKAGFTMIWWTMLHMSIGMIVAMLGWVQYRFRQTRALTMAQFYEIRYSRNLRITSGTIGFISGTLNFGIFPAVGARFFQYFCGLPNYPVTIGSFEIDLVYAAIMVVLLTIAVAFTFMGGQIAVAVTDFLQGTFCNTVFILIAIFVLYKFGWTQISEALSQAPADASLINPMKSHNVDNFNMTYYLIAAFGSIYTFMAWQGNQGYYGAAKTPHDARMGRVLGQLRWMIQVPSMLLIAICAYTLMHHANFASQAQQVHIALDSLNSSQLKSQLTVSVAMTKFLPTGLLGAFAAVMFAAFLSTHDTYLHAWGSMFIQDVYLPIRQKIRSDSKPMSPKVHIWFLRISIIGVAIFVFIFSLLFNQKQDIAMYMALTGTVYLSWAGSVIIGGLYWQRGTTLGAWLSLFVGVALAVIDWCLIYRWQWCQNILISNTPALWGWAQENWPQLSNTEKFPINAAILYFYAILASILSYVVGSLLSSKGRTFNMDRMLHRGKYANDSEQEVEHKPQKNWRKTLSMGKEFSLGDKCLFVFSYGQIFLLFSVFLIGTIMGLSMDVSDTSWLSFWKIFIWTTISGSIVLVIWMTIGGFRDLIVLFKLLRTVKRDDKDDGTVVDHHNFGEPEDVNATSEKNTQRS